MLQTSTKITDSWDILMKTGNRQTASVIRIA